MTAGPYFPGAGAGGGGGGSTVVQQSVIKAYSKWLHKGSNISVREPESPWDLIPADNIYHNDYQADPARPAEASDSQYDRIVSRARVWSRNSTCAPRKFIKGDIYATSRADGSAIDGVTWWSGTTPRTQIKADSHGGELKFLAYYHFNNDGMIADFPDGESTWTQRAHLLEGSGFTLAGGRKWIIDFDVRAVIRTTEQFFCAINMVEDRRDDVAVAVSMIPYGNQSASNDVVYDNNGAPARASMFDLSYHARSWRLSSGIVALENDADFYCLSRPGTPKVEPSAGEASDADTYASNNPGSDWRMMQSVAISEVE